MCEPRNMNSFFISEYDNVAERAGKVEAEVKRLHNTIVEINNHKLKAQQDKLDKINKQLDECASAITKAQVAIKTADRCGILTSFLPASMLEKGFIFKFNVL